MKKIHVLICMIALLSVTSCVNLDLNPPSAASSENWFSSPEEVRISLNDFYRSTFFVIEEGWTLDRNTDDWAQRTNIYTIAAGSLNASSTSNPNIKTVWSYTYKNISRANRILEALDKLEGKYSTTELNMLRAEARFFRAYFYFNLVKRFGDVPYVLRTLDMDSEELMGPRVPKEQVIAGIIKDLEFAETHIPLKSKLPTDVGRLTKGAAQAMLARVALYIGTWNKFHGSGEYKSYLQIAKEASKRLIDSKEYSLYADYRNLFLLPGEDSNEHILSFRYSAEADTYNPRIRATIADLSHSPTKVLADAFLCKDGLPLEKSAYRVEYLPAGKEFENRDPRMALTIWKPGDPFLGKPFVPNLTSQTRTGYMFKKYGDEESYSNMKSRIDEILIRYAEVLLTFAEASFELDDRISDEDLNLSVNALRNRFEGDPNRLPDLTNAFVAEHGLSMRDEIRRERRVELAAESFRYDDIIRWKTAETELPAAILGAKFDPELYPSTVPGKDVILDKNGFILVQNAESRTFDSSKDYLFPLPLREVSLNPNLKQNPNW